MGEFSAGKSTLANILMREALSPVQITATQRPPIWYAHGDGPPVRIDMDGTETVIDAQAVNAAAETAPDDLAAIVEHHAAAV